MFNSLLVILTELPQDLEGLWNMDILGYTTVGAIASVIGSIVYTQIRASIQRRAVKSGLSNTTMVQNQHYRELIEYKIKTEMELKEMREDMIALAKTSVRKEAQEIANKWQLKLTPIQVEHIEAVAQPIIEEVKKIKKKYR